MYVLTKNEYAFRSIRDDILSGKLPGGKKLTVNELASSYNVSPMPIRNALSRLEELGYVRSETHIGTWVCEFEILDYFTNMLMRINAESLATHMVALQHSNELVSRLSSYIDKMREARDASDYERYGMFNRQFHTLINESCNNQLLTDNINRLVDRTNVSVNFFSWLPNTTFESFHEHELIVNAIIASDGNRASTILSYQRCRSNLALLQYMKETPTEEISVDLLRKALLKDGAMDQIDLFIALFSDIQKMNQI